MNIAIALAALTALATTAGGILAIRVRDRLHLILGLSAGLLLGLVAFDLLPEIFEMNTSTLGSVPVVSIALVTGFLALTLPNRSLAPMSPCIVIMGMSTNTALMLPGLWAHLRWPGMSFSMV